MPEMMMAEMADAILGPVITVSRNATPVTDGNKLDVKESAWDDFDE